MSGPINSEGRETKHESMQSPSAMREDTEGSGTAPALRDGDYPVRFSPCVAPLTRRVSSAVCHLGSA